MSEGFYSSSPALGRRVVRHPGVSSKSRWWTSETSASDEFRVDLPAGSDLFSALVAAVAARGFDHGSLVALDGDLAVAKCQTGHPDPKGEIAAVYRAPIEFEGGATVLAGNGTLGHKPDGSPLIHCHAVLIDRLGHAFAGHLPTDLCVVGPKGVRAGVLVPAGAGFAVRPDEETRVSLLAPAEVVATGRTAAGKRWISARIGPNEDLTRAVEKISAAHGLTRAAVRMGIGSLIDGCLRVGEDRHLVEVHGPVVEIITLAGEILPDRDGRPKAELTGRIGGPDGAAWDGVFAVDRNSVLVTAEVVIEERTAA
jgi:predicted DNA-binding protein with PD1-like motif